MISLAKSPCQSLSLSHRISKANADLCLLLSYKQALASAMSARALCAKHGVPFTRPTDYYAEMVKSDSHMERIRQKLLDETYVVFSPEVFCIASAYDLPSLLRQCQHQEVGGRSSSARPQEVRQEGPGPEAAGA